MPRRHTKIGGIIAACIIGALLIGAFALFSHAIRDVVSGIFNHDAPNTGALIEGRLVNSDGRPIRFGGKLLLCGNACYGDTASISGKFRFENIPAGRYMLYGQKKSCKSSARDVVVSTSDITIPLPLVADMCS